MLELHHEYPKQHDYITSNLLWYIISIGLALLGVVFLFVDPSVAGVVDKVSSLWYFYVLSWNWFETSVVYDKTFAKDPEFKKTHNVILAMYWLRASASIVLALMLFLLACYLYRNKFAQDKDETTKQSLLDDEV